MANSNNTATMDSIKKKMQAMKTEKENAADRADQAEQRQKEFEDKLKAVSAITNLFVFVAWEEHRWSLFSLSFQSEEEGNALQKRIQQIEAELDAAQEQLGEANAKLETKEKAAADVRLISFFSLFSLLALVWRYPSSILNAHISPIRALSRFLSRFPSAIFFLSSRIYPNSRRVAYSVFFSFGNSTRLSMHTYIHLSMREKEHQYV